MSTTIPADPAHWAELVTTALLGTDRRVSDGLADTDPTTAVLRQAARHRVVALLGMPTIIAAGVATPGSKTAMPGDSAPAQDRPEDRKSVV